MNTDNTSRALRETSIKVIEEYKSDLADGRTAQNRTGTLSNSFSQNTSGLTSIISGEEYAKYLKTSAEYLGNNRTNQGFLNEGADNVLDIEADAIAEAFADDALKELE